MPKPKPGDFQIVQGVSNSWVEDMIALGERSPWVHVRAVVDDTHYLDPQWPTILIKEGCLADGPHTPIISPDLTPEQRTAVVDALKTWNGRHYGFWAFIWAGLATFIPWLRHIYMSYKWMGAVCSTTVALAYNEAGCYDKLKLDAFETPVTVTPADLARAWGY